MHWRNLRHWLRNLLLFSYAIGNYADNHYLSRYYRYEA